SRCRTWSEPGEGHRTPGPRPEGGAESTWPRHNRFVLITISGLPGSGKPTVARLVAEQLGLEHVYAGDIFRRQAAARGLSLEEYARRAETDHSIDRALDEQMRARAAQDEAVLEGRLAAFMADAAGRRALKVFLDAPESVRAERIVAREGGAAEARLQETQAREASGEPYLTHPVQVAGIIAEMRLDVPSIATGLLHDTVEDTLATLPQIEQTFGGEIATLVDGVTKIGQINFTSREEKQAENFRKMLLAMARDIRVILIKLADRTHNMRTLGHLPPERQVEIAQETLDIYAPLAHR